ncbi:MAG: hypothetical protein C0622_12620 [Desulfuromonas sp.]|nr:MAG: hypothetical protein C0622_12620 [Desulfuromonas sp.]
MKTTLTTVMAGMVLILILMAQSATAADMMQSNSDSMSAGMTDSMTAAADSMMPDQMSMAAETPQNTMDSSMDSEDSGMETAKKKQLMDETQMMQQDSK